MVNNRVLKKSVLDFFNHDLAEVNGRTPFCPAGKITFV